MVISMKAQATLLYDRMMVCLLLGLLLTSYLGTCDGIPTDDDEMVTDDSNAEYPETTITQGTVRGINMVTRNNRTIYGFIGVPYAQPPIGDLRFKAPVQPNPWTQTRLDAQNDADLCPQFNDAGVFVGDEDCLYLNVFTPQLPTNETVTLLPVMMYVVGGGFKTGNNSIGRYGPDYILDKDVILVVPNFRVGVLGYLTTGDEVSPGNYGLKDIVQALKWTQENIEHFGGDHNQVTLFGGSSGAISVHLLALSNSTDGLFHRYITESGSAFNAALALPRQVYTNRSIHLGEYFGCPTNSSILLLDCLRGLEASQLVNTDSLFHKWKSYPSPIWAPTSEPQIEGSLFTDNPAELYTAGKLRDLPWISSITREEGLMFSISFYEDPESFDEFMKDIDALLPVMLGYEHTVDDVSAYTNALKSYYLNDLTANRSVLLVNLTHLMGDANFVYPAYSTFQQQLVVAKSPQYFCSFEYRGTFSYTYFVSGGSTEYKGVTHADETIYLFQTHDPRLGPSGYKNTENDWKMVDTMVQLWTSFATNGTPTIDGTIWGPFTSRNNYLRIGNDSDTSIEMEYDFLEERMQFWKTLPGTKSGAFRNSLNVFSIILSLYLLLNI